MPDVTDQPFTPDFSNEQNIESLISAPLIAVSKANSVMAQGQTRFLLEYCFKKNGDHYEPIMIQMALNRYVIAPATPGIPGTPPVEASAPGVNPVVIGMPGKPAVPAMPESIQTLTTYFNLPLLTIVPLNSLAVDKVTIDFDMEISSVTSSPAKPANNTDNKVIDQKAQLNGKISYDPGSNKSDSNSQNRSQLSNSIKINLNAANLPLPNGVLAIIDLYTKAIIPVDQTKQS